MCLERRREILVSRVDSHAYSSNPLLRRYRCPSLSQDATDQVILPSGLHIVDELGPPYADTDLRRIVHGALAAGCRSFFVCIVMIGNWFMLKHLYAVVARFLSEATAL